MARISFVVTLFMLVPCLWMAKGHQTQLFLTIKTNGSCENFTIKLTAGTVVQRNTTNASSYSINTSVCIENQFSVAMEWSSYCCLNITIPNIDACNSPILSKDIPGEQSLCVFTESMNKKLTCSHEDKLTLQFFGKDRNSSISNCTLMENCSNFTICPSYSSSVSSCILASSNIEESMTSTSDRGRDTSSSATQSLRPSSTTQSPRLSSTTQSLRPSSTTQSPRPSSTTQSLRPSSTTQSPSRRQCEQSGPWNATRPGTLVTLHGRCPNGKDDLVRYCGWNSVWGISKCVTSRQFSETLDEIQRSPEESLTDINEQINQPTSNRNITLDQFAYLLETALQAVIARDNVTSSQANFTQEFMQASDDLIDTATSEPLNDNDRRSIGSQILLSMEELVSDFVNSSDNVFTIKNRMFLKAVEVNRNSSEDSLDFKVGKNSVKLPSQLLDLNQSVRIGFILYSNVSSLLPPDDNHSAIVSSIMSTSITCFKCPRLQELNGNVTIQLHVQNLSEISDRVECVFYDFQLENDSLPTGGWNSSGCLTTVNETEGVVTCSCNHLTNFAILLSPNVELEDDSYQRHKEILNTVSMVMIPISLLCMAMVVLVYALMRSLWSIRNYIHIMLCVSLFMAHFTFIVGIDKTQDTSLCTAVAVLLHYLLLVSFMWMLMEGVVLYVTLVRVFIESDTRYIVTFTVASYLIPALYMLVTVPLGFLVNVNDIPDHTHYLYYVNGEVSACWLNYGTSFVWAFIAPVIVILMLNVGFFIMAIFIMRKHLKKQKNKEKAATLKHWLLASMSLAVVMGLNWLVGLLVFAKELLFLAYISTIFIAGQGIVLFILLVPLSKQVREAYGKLWQKQVRQSHLLKKMVSYVSGPFGDSSSSSSTRKDTVQTNVSKDSLQSRQRPNSNEYMITNSSYIPASSSTSSSYNEDSQRDLIEGNQYTVTIECNVTTADYEMPVVSTENDQ